jgi:KDO2-lipid IV(A) lauroyltransferase
MREANIRRQPANYLWTHNRLKRTHEEFDRQYVMVNGKAIPRENYKGGV